MKTLVVGTGITGVIYGWALQKAGVDVTHFVIPPHSDHADSQRVWRRDAQPGGAGSLFWLSSRSQSLWCQQFT